MVGAGVLGLPYALSQLGWCVTVNILYLMTLARFSRVAGTFTILASWVITFYSLWQLVELHEVVPGKRFDRYPELGEHAFGPKLGYWLVMPQQMLVQVASDIVYMVTGGKSLMKFVEIVAGSTFHGTRQTYFILIFAAVQFVLSQTPNFAAVMSVRVFDFFNGMGTIAFAFAGHSVVLEIQATIPSSPEVPSKKPMWKGVVAAYLIVAFCYLSVAFAGYWAFGPLCRG
ncbi:hypothetical protein EZV62_022626 [Acer yangbiense]|uniref:Amino acid transporter transmembrane domain-containing protein n=1 Tax=Acer yangbiense TaxID=1000413 RepID=A0A5C7H905_9ROSI|nr:hypothetical protein EZV62_022626 [Acer yangbiense]